MSDSKFRNTRMPTNQEVLDWIKERNRVLTEMDQPAFRKQMLDGGAGFISHEATLPAMHKARYNCTDISDELRRESGRWLLEHKMTDLYDYPIDPNGNLP